VTGRPASPRELAEPDGGEGDCRVVSEVPVSVPRTAGYVRVVAGVSVGPFQARASCVSTCRGAGEDEDVFRIVVAVQRHRDAGRDHAPP
jgi:hypothetical protein